MGGNIIPQYRPLKMIKITCHYIYKTCQKILYLDIRTTVLVKSKCQIIDVVRLKDPLTCFHFSLMLIHSQL